MFLQSELHKNFLDDLSLQPYFAPTRTIASIFWLCCSNQARHARQVRCPIMLLLIRRFSLIVTSNCYLEKVWHHWTNNFVSCLRLKRDTQASNFCTQTQQTKKKQQYINDNMLQITGLETVESILHFQISAQRLVFITSVMSKASALLLCTV